MNTFRLLGLPINAFFLLKSALLLLVLISFVVVFVGVPLFVNGESMEPNFHSRELVFVERLSYSGTKPIKRGDVVAAKFPADPERTRLIKRVIGLPGERIELKDNQFYINGTPLKESYAPKLGQPPYIEITDITLKSDQYFLAGDNRPGSSDSRLWGPVQVSDIQGRVGAVLLPVNRTQFVLREQF